MRKTLSLNELYVMIDKKEIIITDNQKNSPELDAEHELQWMSDIFDDKIFDPKIILIKYENGTYKIMDGYKISMSIYEYVKYLITTSNKNIFVISEQDINKFLNTCIIITIISDSDDIVVSI
jgi:hypothetical protein